MMGVQLAKFKRSARHPIAGLRNVEGVLEKKTVSPRHPTTVKHYEDIIKKNPQFKSEVTQRNDALHKMLQVVKVDSEGGAPDQVLKTGKKLRLPMDGMLSVEQIDEMFLNRKLEPEIWTNEKVGEHYKIDFCVAENLLKHYSSFRIYKVPKEKVVDEKLLRDEERRKMLLSE